MKLYFGQEVRGDVKKKERLVRFTKYVPETTLKGPLTLLIASEEKKDRRVSSHSPPQRVLSWYMKIVEKISDSVILKSLTC